MDTRHRQKRFGIEVWISWHIKWLVCVLLISGCDSIPQQKFVEFMGEETAVNDVLTTEGPVSWSAARPTMLRVVLVKNQSVSIHLRCQTKPLDSNFTLNFVRFTFDSENRWRTTLNVRQRRKRIRVLKNGIYVDFVFDEHNGGNATLTNLPPMMQLDNVRFYCEVKNRLGFRTSNQVEFFDYRRHFPRSPRVFKGPRKIDTKSPHLFHCLSRDFTKEPSVVIPYLWKACNSVSNSSFSVLDLAEDWRVQVFSNGTLYWPYVPSNVVKRLKGHALICNVLGTTMAEYKGLSFINSTVADQSEPQLVKPAPTEKFETVQVLDSSDTVVRLPLVIKGDRPDLLVKWTNDKKVVSSERKKGKCFLKPDKGSSIPVCRGPFSKHSADAKWKIYTVEVSNSRGKRNSASKSHKGQYMVDFSRGFPKMSDSMESLVLVADGGDVDLECRFKSLPMVVADLTVLGRKIEFSSDATIASSVKEINDDNKKEMAPLNVSISVKPFVPGKRLVYHARQMVYRDRNGLSTTHYIECIGYRHGYTEKFEIRHPVQIRVTPRPDISLKDTTNTSSVKSAVREFTCFVHNRKEIEETEAELQFKWVLNWTAFEDLSEKKQEALKVNETRLVVEKAIWSSNISISCRVELLYPASAQRGPSRPRVFFHVMRSEIVSFTTPWSNLTAIIIVIILGFIIMCVLLIFGIWIMKKMKKKKKMKLRKENNCLVLQHEEERHP